MNAQTAPDNTRRFSTGTVALFVTLGTESVFFLTLLVAYAALRDQSGWVMDHGLVRLAIPLANTAILLASAATAWKAIGAARSGPRGTIENWLWITLLLGLVFVAGQVFEYRHAGLHIDDASFGGVFFTLMGFHALHVLAGIVFIGLNLVRSGLGDFDRGRREPIVLGSWFWFYVTAVWLVLFTALYLV